MALRGKYEIQARGVESDLLRNDDYDNGPRSIANDLFTEIAIIFSIADMKQ